MAEFIIRIGYSNLYKSDGALWWSSGAHIDADGAPKAYHPVSSKGLDALANAGHPGNWWGIVTVNGKPVIQKASDPAPGFYVSTTSLENHERAVTDPRRYVDSDTVPFIVIPGGFGLGIKMGDFGICYNTVTGDNCFVIAADIGPKHQIGEVSIEAARELKIPCDPRTGGVSGGIISIVFPGSGSGYQEGTTWFHAAFRETLKFGGLARVKELIDHVA